MSQEDLLLDVISGFSAGLQEVLESLGLEGPTRVQRGPHQDQAFDGFRQPVPLFGHSWVQSVMSVLTL